MKESEKITYKEKALQIYKSFCELNYQTPNEQQFLAFVKCINEIASQLPIPVKARPEQAVSMYAILTSEYKRTFMQLPTGTGKSLMFGLMARYTNSKRGVKVVVVVPNKVLAAIQQGKYCPWASKVSDDLYREDIKEAFYCTYKDFRTGEIPLDAVIMVDEIDALFFNDKPKLKDNKLISTILLLNKYEVVGMTATFRGDQGKSKILELIKGSHTINTTNIVMDRELQLDIFGKLKEAEVNAKLIEVAKEKQQQIPVIIILKSIQRCEEMEQCFDQCIIFGKGQVFDQLGSLELIQVQKSPYPVILTTSQASLGQDLTLTAYVIQTEIPVSYAAFVQNAGRSNRIDTNAALIGALIVTNPILTIESVKQGCEYEQQRQQLFKPEYLKCLRYLECASLVDPVLLTFKQAFKLFENGASASELYKKLATVQKFKSALQSKELEKPVAGAFKVPKAPIKAKNWVEEEKENSGTESVLGKCNESERIEKLQSSIMLCGQVQVKGDIRSFGALSMCKRQTTYGQAMGTNSQAMSILVSQHNGSEADTLRDDISNISMHQWAAHEYADLQPEPLGAVATGNGLSFGALDELARQKAREILHGDMLVSGNVSQVGGDARSSAAAAHRKRDGKAATKSTISNKSYAKIGEYPCYECGKMFDTSDKRKSHKYKVHTSSGKAKQSAAAKKFKHLNN